MDGTVKWFGKEKGYGFINVPKGEDYFFHISQVQGAKLPGEGDKVSFSLSVGRDGKPAATSVVITSQRTKRPNRPYFGKATYRTEIVEPGESGVSRGCAIPLLAVVGFVIGVSSGGFIGAIIGIVIGIAIGVNVEEKEGKIAITKKVEIISPCIRCGGKGQVTAQVDGRTGFQCQACGSSWTQGRDICIRCSKKGQIISQIGGQTEWKCETCGCSWKHG